MTSFRYQAIEANGNPVKGLIEAEDRRAALRMLGEKGLFPSTLEAAAANGKVSNGVAASPAPKAKETKESPPDSGASGFRIGTGIPRKDITSFSREMAALLGAAIPIPQALEGIADEEENPALKAVVAQISDGVRTGTSFSAALGAHPKLFSKLYVSMVRVGEEAGALPKVMNDLANLLEHEDEVRGEVVAAISYPVFVFFFGIATVIVLLTVVMPKMFSMLQDMLTVLPLPTLILLRVSGFLHHNWYWLALGIISFSFGFRWYVRTPRGALVWDATKLRIPVMGGVLRSAALARFARTLGTLVKSGVSLLPALKIVENTIGNLILAQQVAQVTEETRGGDSLATPLRRLGIFPKSAVQMIAVGEETGRLDEMLLKVAEIEERHMRSKTKTLISLLAPVLILIVGALVGFMVIALLLPIFKMSRGIH
ncbi:MAG TPA: type II secretion system F family protein [Candidatus Limnocylindria bacterium]|jgi:general secretion pathway protein F|nr:type II secretion system F family protein [Candidatus Limnocylindria bacterium]